MAGKKIGELTPLGRNLIASDELELSLAGSAGSRKVTGAQLTAGLQPTLVSGTNIKTINGSSVLGSGDLTISGGVTSVTGTSPVVSSGGTTPAISMPAATNAVSGYLTSTDWDTFNNKQAALVSGINIKTINGNTLLGSSDIAVQPTLVSGTNIKTINGNSVLGSGNLVISGGVTGVTASTPLASTGGTAPNITIQQANGSQNGYLSNVDWNTFNNKQAALVSGTNIKTINGQSILGSGNIFAGGNKALLVPTFENEYQAPGGATNTVMFAVNAIYGLGQQIDIDLTVRNNNGLSSVLRFYINSTNTLTGAAQVGNVSLIATTDYTNRYFHRLSVTRDIQFFWNLYGQDLFAWNDFDAGQTYSYAAQIGFNAPTKSWIIVTLNQSASLVNASITY